MSCPLPLMFPINKQINKLSLPDVPCLSATTGCHTNAPKPSTATPLTGFFLDTVHCFTSVASALRLGRNCSPEGSLFMGSHFVAEGDLGVAVMEASDGLKYGSRSLLLQSPTKPQCTTFTAAKECPLSTNTAAIMARYSRMW